MGQCYGKNIPVTEDDDGDARGRQIPHPNGGDAAASAAAKSGAATPASGNSAWPSPYPQGTASPLPVGVSPSPARSTPRRFFKRPFPPPSPAKHIKASLAKRQGPEKPIEGPIPEDGGAVVGSVNNEGERPLDKSFGYGKNFGAKYEVVKEVGRGHFGHTCSARAKKGEIKGQLVAVKIISKAKVRWCVKFDFCLLGPSLFIFSLLDFWKKGKKKKRCSF